MKLIKKLVEFVRNKHGDDIPGMRRGSGTITAFKIIYFSAKYRSILKAVSKNSPVAGLIQVTRPATLPILKDFCNKRLSIDAL